MKFNIKRFVIWITVFMFAAFITAGIILAVTGNLALAVEQIDESKTFDAQQINKIYVDIVSTDINVIPTCEEEIAVHLYGEVSTNKKMELPSLLAYQSGDELRIEIIQPKTILIGISIWRTKLDIYIPQDSIETLKMDTVSSDASISDLKLNEINFKTVSGDIYVEQEDSSSMNIRTTSGDIGISFSEDVQFYLKAKTVSGDIENRFPIKITSSSRRDLEGIVGK